jgi:hypothetical protein
MAKLEYTDISSTSTIYLKTNQNVSAANENSS